VIYLDAAVCIYAVESIGERGVRARDLLRGSDEALCVSPLVQMECLIKPFQEADIALEEQYRRFLAGMTMLEIAPVVYERAARVRASANIKTADALHLATALEAGCDALWTADSEFAKRSSGFAVDVFKDLSTSSS